MAESCGLLVQHERATNLSLSPIFSYQQYLYYSSALAQAAVAESLVDLQLEFRDLDDCHHDEQCGCDI